MYNLISSGSIDYAIYNTENGGFYLLDNNISLQTIIILISSNSNNLLHRGSDFTVVLTITKIMLPINIAFL